jgi:hypothetical protein
LAPERFAFAQGTTIIGQEDVGDAWAALFTTCYTPAISFCMPSSLLCGQVVGNGGQVWRKMPVSTKIAPGPSTDTRRICLLRCRWCGKEFSKTAAFPV